MRPASYPRTERTDNPMIERPEREAGRMPARPRAAYVVTAARPPRLSWRSRWRGLCAVVALLLSAADALVSAVLGIPPAALRLRRVGPLVGEAYRAGARGCPVVVLAPVPADDDGQAEKDGA